MLHIRVLDRNDAELGQRFLAIHKMQAGRVNFTARRSSHAICMRIIDFQDIDT